MKENYKWVAGHPTEDGIYWWDSGFDFLNLRGYGMIAQRKSGYTWIVGDNGSFPLKIFKDGAYPNAKHAKVKPTVNWTEYSDYGVFGNTHCRAWIRDPKGYVGFGLIKEGGHGLIGSIAWWDHPTYGYDGSVWIRPEDKYMFSLIEKPKLNKVVKDK